MDPLTAFTQSNIDTETAVFFCVGAVQMIYHTSTGDFFGKRPKFSLGVCFANWSIPGIFGGGQMNANETAAGSEFLQLVQC